MKNCESYGDEFMFKFNHDQNFIYMLSLGVDLELSNTKT